MGVTRKGIIMAGGSGSRLDPITRVVNKHLLPVFDKPMIYYPLTTLMLAGIRDILVITSPGHDELLRNLLGDGSAWGLNISFALQESPRGLADAFHVGADFVGTNPVALVLGDNIFHGQGLSALLQNVAASSDALTLFAVAVKDPQRFGVVELSPERKPLTLVEKPEHPKSNLAVTGLYFYDGRAVELARTLKPSKRGELEITDLNRLYVEEGTAKVEVLHRGYTWFDMGTPESLLQASTYVEIIQARQSLGIAWPEEVAWRMGFLSDADLDRVIGKLPRSNHSAYLKQILSEPRMGY